MRRRGKLIPFAAWHPDAKVVGIDLSPVQIEQGRRRVQALGLTNLELLQGDIASVDPVIWRVRFHYLPWGLQLGA